MPIDADTNNTVFIKLRYTHRLEFFTVIENDAIEKYLIKENMWISNKVGHKEACIV